MSSISETAVAAQPVKRLTTPTGEAARRGDHMLSRNNAAADVD
jgi:hypothetical protein